MESGINMTQQLSSINAKRKRYFCGSFLFCFGFFSCFATTYYGLHLSHGGIHAHSSYMIVHSDNDQQNDSISVSNTTHLAVEKPPKEGKAMLLAAEKTKQKKITFVLVIVVISAPENKKRRTIIQQTWAFNISETVKVTFVVCTKDLKPRVNHKLFKERDFHADLLLLSNLTDVYKSLTIKVIESMKWVKQNFQFDYLLKTDDDSFVRVDGILENLKDKQLELLYWGFIYYRAPIQAEGKWTEPKHYICDTYVDYAAGGGYVLSYDLVAYIVDNSNKLKTFTNEDVSVGTWLAPLDVKIVHDQGFIMLHHCREDFIIFHQVSMEEMRRFHRNLMTNTTLCNAPKKMRQNL